MKILNFFGSIWAVVSLITLTHASPHSLEARAAAKKRVVVGYYPDWAYNNFLPSDLNLKHYTHLYYAFALQIKGSVPVFADPGVLDENVAYGFPALVKAAKKSGTGVMISVGGWSGSTKFSPMAASRSSRKAFIDWNVKMVTKYNLAGVDLDWEYPGAAGPGCNEMRSNDVDNYIKLVKELHAALKKASPKKKREITLAVHIKPWAASKVRQFVPYVDRFHIMTFDINGVWNSTSGPNSPFKAQPGHGFHLGFANSLEAWKKAGVPYSKLAGGVGYYGRSQTLTVKKTPTTQYNPAIASKAPLGDSDDGPFTNPYCSLESYAASGIWKYKKLRSQGVLTSPTKAAKPWIRTFDDYTKTPWLYNPKTKQYISYDDPVSIGIKARWAKKKNMAGLFAWNVQQDNGELAKAMQLVR
ncbi:glycoside hydrolase superfamily [Pilobolus umbonatus]|nr:glycoside hydrolase superfamily [Pilobolus umbonatus]